jgi:hypothetical protein
LQYRWLSRCILSRRAECVTLCGTIQQSISFPYRAVPQAAALASFWWEVRGVAQDYAEAVRLSLFRVLSMSFYGFCINSLHVALFLLSLLRVRIFFCQRKHVRFV